MPPRRAHALGEAPLGAILPFPARPAPAAAPPPDHRHGHRQRLRERFAAAPDGLPDYEVLEALLHLAIPRQDTKPMAKALLARFGTLGAVLAADPARLMEVGGIKEASVHALKLVREIGLRMLREEARRGDVISSWDQLLAYARAAMADNPIEQFRIVFLDNRNRVIRDEEQSRGTVNHTPVYPREVVRRALELHASAIVMMHNHPSGDPQPSRADIDMTRQVRDALKAVDIALHDHVVVTRTRHASFRALGLL